MKKIVAAIVGCSSAMLGTMPATAQEQQADTDEALGEIVVTGSRIVRDGYTAPTPVTVATATELMKAVPTNLPDALNKQLPQFALSSSPSRSTHNFANTATHGNILNLRGVGGNRTLIMFDGVRMPPTTFRGDVDTNVIPSALIERVDVVTAGASAAYGSDAVAGVVNFVLDRNFEGIKASAQAGMSEEGDNENNRLSLAWGGNFADGRGRLMLSAERYDNDGMLRGDREESLQNWIFAGATPGGGVAGTATNPYTLWDNTRLTAATDNGKIIGGPFNNYQIADNGSIIPFIPGPATGTVGFFQGGDGYSIPADVSAVAPLTTEQYFGRVSYDFSDNLSGYIQANFTTSDLSYTSLANSWTGVTNAPVFNGNPYIPAVIQAALTQPDETFQIGKYTSGMGANPVTDEVTDFWMATAGLDGSFGERWTWNAAYTHGDSEHQMDQSGLYNWQRAYAAVDAVRAPNGSIVCRPTLDPDPAIRARFAGCQPINIFLTGRAYLDQPGYAYATGTSSYTASITQDHVMAMVQGPVADLPAGQVDLAAGLEYRTQELKLTSNADPALLDTAAERNAYFAGLRGVAPSALFYWLTNVGVADGDVDVTEAFAEVNVPLLADRPGAQSLEFNAAGRFTDYSTSGSVETWKFGLTWRPIDELLFRGTVSRDIRAPTLFDLFAGDQSGIGFLVDPVSGISQNVTTITGGNPDLDPEESDTWTVGLVWSPEAANLQVSVDYYSLEIADAIGTLNTTQIVNNCYQDPAAPECALITRPGPGQFPTQVRVAPANIAFLETAGFDIDASYRMNVGNGDLTFRVYANYLDKFITQQSATAPVYEYTGRGLPTSTPVGYPEWRGTFNINYAIGNLTFFLSEQYIGPIDLGGPEPNQTFVDPQVGAEWYTDLTISSKTDLNGGELEIFGTVNNLFNDDFPLIPGTIPGVNLPTILPLYDTVGRAYMIGVRYRL